MATFRRNTLFRLVGRLLQAGFVVWAASTATFVLLRSAPGDPYANKLEDFAVPESTRAAWRAQRGLDDPLPVQYVRWMGNAVRGDFGWSIQYRRPVGDVLRELLPRTLLLMSLALCTSVLAGMVLGSWQGTVPGTLGDEVATGSSLLLYSVPEFWLALLLMQLFAQTLGWFPPSGMVGAFHESLPPWAQFTDRVKHLVLPWLTLSLVGTALFARYQRSSMVDAWREPFVRTARAKGLREGRVRWHAWRTALVPVITLTGLVFPALLGGAVFVERIFSWPGMGNATIRAVSARDYELVTAAVVIASLMTAVGSLLADWMQQLADPRARS